MNPVTKQRKWTRDTRVCHVFTLYLYMINLVDNNIIILTLHTKMFFSTKGLTMYPPPPRPTPCLFGSLPLFNFCYFGYQGYCYRFFSCYTVLHLWCIHLSHTHIVYAYMLVPHDHKLMLHMVQMCYHYSAGHQIDVNKIDRLPRLNIVILGQYNVTTS